MDLHLHVFERFDAGARRRAILQIGNRESVEQIVVADRNSAAQREARRLGLILHPVHVRIAGVGDGRNGIAHEVRHPADARQRLERRFIEHVAGRRVRRVDERRFRGDCHGLFDRADLEDDVERQELLRADTRILALERLEAGDRRANRVHARRYSWKRVFAGVVRGRVARHAGFLIDERDGRAGNHALRIPDGTAQAALERLRREMFGEEQHDERREDEPYRSHDSSSAGSYAAPRPRPPRSLVGAGSPSFATSSSACAKVSISSSVVYTFGVTRRPE